MAIKNPRFPHRCKVYYKEGEDAWHEGEEVVVYEGECRRYNNTSLRTFYKDTKAGRVSDGDYGVSIPPHEKAIKPGYLIDIVDGVEEAKGIAILDVYRGNLGTTIYFNKPKN